MKVRDLLPIGSIVRLNDGKKRLMINGVMQSNAEGDGKEYDYLGVMYPEGHLGEGFSYLFNHEDIQEIFFRGFEDRERDDFIDRLAAFYEQ